MRIAVGQYALVTPFTANTGFLVSGEEGLWDWLGEAVDEDIACFQTFRDLLSVCNVPTEDAGAESGVCVVGTGDDFFLIRPGSVEKLIRFVKLMIVKRDLLGWDDRAKWLFLDDSRVVGWVVDDRWI
jgi:hypothetical protein